MVDLPFINDGYCKVLPKNHSKYVHTKLIHSNILKSPYKKTFVQSTKTDNAI